MDTITKQGRGQLTQRIKDKSKELLGEEITVRELRLMPYLQYTMMNSRKLSPSHLNSDEQDVLSKWVKNGYITDGVTEELGRPMMSEGSKLNVTKNFWDSMNEILFLGYVDLSE